MIKYLFLIIGLPISAFCQTILSASVGIGTYRMNGMKVLQNEFASSMIVDAKKVMVFPGYAFYEISCQHTIKEKIIIGGMISYGSTAGRISYSDYSGNLNVDQLLKALSASVHIGKSFKLKNEKMTVTADLQPGITYTGLDLLFQQTVGPSSESEKYNFTSLNINVQPTIACIRRMGKFGLQAKLGYNQTVVSGKLIFDGNKEAYLTDRNDAPLFANWSGLRTSLGIVYYVRR